MNYQEPIMLANVAGIPKGRLVESFGEAFTQEDKGSVDRRIDKLFAEGNLAEAMLSESELAAGDASDGSESAPVEHALELFSRMSVQLTDSYRTLEKRVSQLNGELTTEVEQRRQELEEKERIADRLSTLLDVLPAGVVVLDGKGVVSECNPAALGLLGEPLLGESWVNIIKRCFAPRRDDGHEVSLKDGRRVRIETRSMSEGPGQLVLLTDLTETRELQAQVSRTERLSSLGRMVASLAHQIRTPLSTAMLYAGHLNQPEISDDMRQKCAEKIMSRLTHLEHQIRDMLVFAKGDTRLAESVKASDLFEQLKLAADTPIKNAHADVEWQDCSENTSLLCNRDTLVGACLNLINNSIEAKAEGVKINVKIVSPGKGYINIEVSDNGPGFSAEQKNKILDAFYTTKSHGTGLGLPVVQAVVKAHHGRFYITSNDEGAKAVITLPVHEQQSKA
ncbi:sensor histidine kinase [Alkalimarinus sediminis]|uniref:histidine kinase n=1 Tax=Alkalimarinus sediminis TaxID=1632866 RepID=A0A9E8KQT2_9ALTE|nr:ATP-binding protein [Alkalimarinus sediminis]UZW76763.1 ATP-binding protein [Alkalimarinus sediminis]